MAGRTILIANAGGYWGDDLTALRRQLTGGRLDYVTIDFLAEITMSIMQKQRQKDPGSGYAHDFVSQMRELLPEIVKRRVKIITNAGGINPVGCAEAILKVARELELDLKVGVVHGDDLMPRLAELEAAGHTMANMDTGEPYAKIRGKAASANAYFGAWPVVEALRQGAQVIVTGRVTDTGITLAPMIHEFGWTPGDWDRLASGIVAGHIIECGAQATGGNFTYWEAVKSYANIGYPIVEVSEDGSFVVTKHEGTGGRVSVGTVSEQLVYEMGDPHGYITPDVTADFTTIQLAGAGPDRVRVTGVKGRRAAELLKVSMSYQGGFKSSGGIVICGPRALEKARKFASIFWERLGHTYEAALTEYFGHDACHGPMTFESCTATEPAEVLLRLGVRDADREKCDEFARLVPSLILSGPPGVTVTGGRPPVSGVLGYWPCLVPRGDVSAIVETMGTDGSRVGGGYSWPPLLAERAIYETPAPPSSWPQGEGLVEVCLGELAHGRSGDKGDTANVGILARSPEVYAWLARHLTAERVKGYFGAVCRGTVERHEVPNLLALNFLLNHSLGGGGTLSLHADAQGKTYAHALLKMRLSVPGGLPSTVPAEAP